MGVAWGFGNYRPVAPKLSMKGNDMKLTSDQIAALREFGDWAEQVAEKLARGETVALEREVKRWEPIGGSFVVCPEGKVFAHPSLASCQRHGSVRSCRRAAKRFADDQRIFNRLHAYREEFAPGYVVPEIGNSAYCLILEGAGWVSVSAYCHRSPTCVYMPKEVAEDLASKLNSGEVVL